MAMLSTEIILLYTSENKHQYLCIDYISLNILKINNLHIISYCYIFKGEGFFFLKQNCQTL